MGGRPSPRTLGRSGSIARAKEGRATEPPAASRHMRVTIPAAPPRQAHRPLAAGSIAGLGERGSLLARASDPVLRRQCVRASAAAYGANSHSPLCKHVGLGRVPTRKDGGRASSPAFAPLQV